MAYIVDVKDPEEKFKMFSSTQGKMVSTADMSAEELMEFVRQSFAEESDKDLLGDPFFLSALYQIVEKVNPIDMDD